MDAQSGTAPADARDPHAYADGYRRGIGPYALPGVPPLHLDDTHPFGTWMIDRLERGHSPAGAFGAYDMQLSYGTAYDRALLKAEGEIAHSRLHESRTEALWSHAIAPFWDLQTGLRADTFSGGTSRAWLALGVQGVTPYWVEVDATAYLGDAGRTALRLSADYDLRLTQRLVLQPRVEVALYGRDDPANGIGSGLSSTTAGLRLRYAFGRQWAPYIGVERRLLSGRTADMARTAGEPTGDTRWLIGLRLWF